MTSFDINYAYVMYKEVSYRSRNKFSI